MIINSQLILIASFRFTYFIKYIYPTTSEWIRLNFQNSICFYNHIKSGRPVKTKFFWLARILINQFVKTNIKKFTNSVKLVASINKFDLFIKRFDTRICCSHTSAWCIPNLPVFKATIYPFRPKIILKFFYSLKTLQLFLYGFRFYLFCEVIDPI